MAIIHQQNPFMDKVMGICNKLSLSDEQYEALSKRAEAELRDNRSMYMLKVILLAISGYMFILIVVALLIWAIVASVKLLMLSRYHGIAVAKLVLVLLVPIYVIAKSLWIKVPEPTGYQLKRANAPQLFELIDELCATLGTRVDTVLLDAQYNAAVVQVPRLGPLGFHKNILMLGMPLMLVLKPQEFKAVLAHELGHLSGNHSKSSAWIYGVRGRWGKLFETISDAGSGFYALFLIFFSWMSPRFSAYSLALARSHELEADADAVKIAGYDAFKMSMYSLSARSLYLDGHFWPRISNLVKASAKVPDDIFVRMKNEMGQYTPAKADVEKAIKMALEETGAGVETHPPLTVRLISAGSHPQLTDRLTAGKAAVNDTENKGAINDAGDNAAIDDAGSETSSDATGDTILVQASDIESLCRPFQPEESAASAFFGAHFDSTLSALSKSWQEEKQEGWKLSHEEYQNVVDSLKKLDEKSLESPLTVSELKLKSYLLGQVEDEKACLPIYQEILERAPQENGIRLKLGQGLLEEDFEQGMDLIKKAMAGQSTLIPTGCALLMPILKEKDREEELADMVKRLEKFSRDVELARKERLSVKNDSILEPHELSEEDREYLKDIFVQIPAIEAAYLVRKFVQYLPDSPYLVIGLEIKTKATFGEEVEQERFGIAQWMIANLQLTDEFCVVAFDSSTAKIKKNIVAMDNSLIYRKG